MQNKPLAALADDLAKHHSRLEAAAGEHAGPHERRAGLDEGGEAVAVGATGRQRVVAHPVAGSVKSVGGRGEARIYPSAARAVNTRGGRDGPPPGGYPLTPWPEKRGLVRRLLSARGSEGRTDGAAGEGNRGGASQA